MFACTWRCVTPFGDKYLHGDQPRLPHPYRIYACALVDFTCVRTLRVCVRQCVASFGDEYLRGQVWNRRAHCNNEFCRWGLWKCKQRAFLFSATCCEKDQRLPRRWIGILIRSMCTCNPNAVPVYVDRCYNSDVAWSLIAVCKCTAPLSLWHRRQEFSLCVPMLVVHGGQFCIIPHPNCPACSFHMPFGQ